MKKLFITMLLGIFMTVSCGTEEDDAKVVGLAADSNVVPFVVAENNSVRAYAETNGYRVIYNDAEDDIARHIANIETLIAQSVDYIVFSPINTLAYENVLKSIKDANIPVILIDSTVEGATRGFITTEIISDFKWQGKVAAEWILSNYEGNVSVVELYGGPGASAAIDRNKGFMEIVQRNPRIKVIASQVGAWNRSQGQLVTVNILQANRDKKIDVIYSHNAEMALGAIVAVKDAGLSPQDIAIIGIDGQKEAVKAVKRGDMAVTITSNPRMGREVFEVISMLEKDQTPPKTIIIQDVLYDRNSIDEYTDPY